MAFWISELSREGNYIDFRYSTSAQRSSSVIVVP
jgi:hypothetical protein